MTPADTPDALEELRGLYASDRDVFIFLVDDTHPIEIGKLKKELYEIISLHSGQKLSKVEKDSDRDYWMTATEAKEYGMVDEVLERNPRKSADTESK